MTQTQKSTPGVADRGHHEAITTNTSGSESTSMDTLWNLENMSVYGVLGSGRELSRDMFSDSDVERFEAKVDRSAGPDACHEWTAYRLNGYGSFSLGGKMCNAHRVAYVLAYGLIPAGLVVRHRCDTPPCCNPAHLTIGTAADNSRDMVERDRQVKGEAQRDAKLTVEDVNELRRRVRSDNYVTYTELAAEYGVASIQVADAVTGKAWKHADEPPVDDIRTAHGPRREWTEDEDAAVFDGSLDEVAARLGRSRSSVMNRRRVLRLLAGEDRPTRQRQGQRRWTPAEDAVVFGGTAREVAARLGRTVSSVANRRAVLRRRQAVAA